MEQIFKILFNGGVIHTFSPAELAKPFLSGIKRFAIEHYFFHQRLEEIAECVRDTIRGMIVCQKNSVFHGVYVLSLFLFYNSFAVLQSLVCAVATSGSRTAERDRIACYNR
ncbi:MAG: hypothetical protein IKX38_06060 [Bacteroidales bacterium]|nr:hypothetical protein [Bacteroidales bacterium]